MRRLLILLLVAAALVILSTDSRAQTGSDYDLSWWTIDAGGSTNTSGGVYSLSATIGQPDASTSSGSGYSLVGGFWADQSSAVFKTYLPSIQR